ncbi:MAG: phosphatidate cytidylyltransferase [Granulosicoccus sp.]|nr:phosphatidate cytidylyltransferase [Granulosicoccus sp.]
MLKTRIITALILLVGFAAVLFLASIDVFALILGFVVAAAAWEWSRLSGVRNEHAQTAFAAMAGLIALIGLYIPYNDHFMRWLLLPGFLFWLCVPALFYLAAPKPVVSVLDGGRGQAIHRETNSPLLAVGIFIFFMTALSLQSLRSFAPDASSWLLLYALSIVWFMDIGAYFSGRRFGHRKLAPGISPGKTWEGVYGGLAVTGLLLLVVLLSADWADGNRFKLLVATVLAAAASVLGDLYESRLKRAAGLKDSSQMLPGHGGVLDRIDGVVAAIPVFTFAWFWL